MLHVDEKGSLMCDIDFVFWCSSSMEFLLFTDSGNIPIIINTLGMSFSYIVKQYMAT